MKLPPLKRIHEVISRDAIDALEAHAPHTRHAGTATLIDVDLVVPGAMSVGQAHTIYDRIEAGLKAAIEGAIVIIHVEPEEKAKHSGLRVI